MILVGSVLICLLSLFLCVPVEARDVSKPSLIPVVAIHNLGFVFIPENILIPEQPPIQRRAASRLLLLGQIMRNFEFENCLFLAGWEHLIKDVPFENSPISQVVRYLLKVAGVRMPPKLVANDDRWAFPEVDGREHVMGGTFGKFSINMSAFGIFEGLGVEQSGFGGGLTGGGDSLQRLDLTIGMFYQGISLLPSTLHLPDLISHSFGSASHLFSLVEDSQSCNACDNNQPPFGPFEGCVPLWRAIVGTLGMVSGFVVIFRGRARWTFWFGALFFWGGSFVWLTGHANCKHTEQDSDRDGMCHSREIVSQKDLTRLSFCNTVSGMANVLSAEKQTAIIAALAEGSSIRSIERITGVHRDTIMRLGVKVGQGCTALLDEKMRNLPCRFLQLDEIWGFIGKKERHVRPDDDPQYGNVWTFCAIDAETKLVPSFKCGKRDLATAKAFVGDVQGRMAGRIQISSDALKAYQDAIEQTFGADVDFGQIIKTYEHDESQNAERKYSAAKFVSVEKRSVTGSPDMDLVSTSYIERLNATTRLHMRRLTRLTLAFSKKLENFASSGQFVGNW
jgi:IS1 family transposase